MTNGTTAAPAPVPQEVLDDLRRRLRSSRIVDAPGDDWSRGTDHADLVHRRARAGGRR